MVAFYRSLLALVPVVLLVAACGGDDDDSNGDAGDESSGATSERSSGDGARIPQVRDANFVSGKVHIEVSGDKDFKVDSDGNGIAANGFTLLTYGSEDATVILSFQSAGEGPGALSLTTAQLATSGEWGRDCTLKIEDGSDELKGEFTCKELDAIDPKTVKDFQIRVFGSFSAKR